MYVMTLVLLHALRVSLRAASIIVVPPMVLKMYCVFVSRLPLYHPALATIVMLTLKSWRLNRQR